MAERLRSGSYDVMSVREFRDAGLIWLVNRTLHPFGIALAVTVDTESGAVNEELGLRPVAMFTDPEGIMFSYEDEKECREMFYQWLKERYSTGVPVDPITAVDESQSEG